MHLLVVSPEVVVPRKALPTLRALEHPLSQVQQQVGLETLRPAEALAALGAVVRSDSRVLPLVPLQVARLPEAVAAVGAQVRLLPRVRPQVHVELPHVREALGAVRAGVGFLAGVNALVLLEAVFVAEAFSAVGAEEEDFGVQAGVPFERVGAGVGLVANGALEYLLLFLLLHADVFQSFGFAVRQVFDGVVPPDVFEQVVFDGKGKLAERAWEDFGLAEVFVAVFDFLMVFES